MANPAELVPLLYHADWTTWSFSADIVVRRRPSVRAGSGAVGRGPEWVESRHRIQMAPGGRYRIEPVGAGDPQDGDHAELATLVVCDGQSCWIISGNEAERHVADPERTAIDDIVHPSWLLSGFQLAVTGEGEVAGRAAHELRGTPRLPIRHPPMTGYGYIDHVNVLVDAELGMVLRWEAISADRPVEIVELQDLAVDQRADQDPALFRPGTGIVVEDGFGPLPADSGHGLDWQGRGHESSGTGDDADTVAATLGSAALGLALRRLARAEPPRGSGLDDEAAMPAADDDEPPGDPEPASDELLNLIARTGLPRLNLTAQAHRWVDVQTALHGYRSVVTGFDHERMQQFTSGFFGPDSIWAWVRGGHRSAGCVSRCPTGT